VGVLLGILTVRRLSPRVPKERLVAVMFAIGGLAALLISLRPEGWPLLLGAAITGFTFAWKKSAVDAMVQESFPDGYRGRVQTVYDICYHLARVAAGALAIWLIEPLGDGGTIALVGVVFLAWSPALPALVRGIPAFSVRFAEGARAEEWPRAIVWGGVEEEVEVLRSALVDQDGRRLRTFRLALADGSVVDVAKPEPDGEWRLVREAED
jgi:MFS family permease